MSFQDFGCERYPVPEREAERIKVLESYMILGLSPEVVFDRITSFAKRLFGVEISVVSLVDATHARFKSKQGVSASGVERKHAICSYAILESAPDVLVFTNLLNDPRFVDYPLVANPPRLRFYAGAPLFVENGHKIGTLCVMSPIPRTHFSIREKQDLIDLASMVVDELKLRRNMMQANFKYLVSISQELQNPLFSFAKSLALLDQTELSAEQKSLLVDAKGNVELMEWTIENVLAATRCNYLATNCRLVQKRVCIENVLLKLKNISTYFPKMIPLTFEIKKFVPQYIISDPCCILHSLLNFVTNSCKFTTEGKIHLSVCVISPAPRLNIQGGQDGRVQERIRFSVEDTGPGISHPHLLFQPIGWHTFDQKQCTEGRGMTQSGCGLGLYSVYLQMQAIGGSCGHHPRMDGKQGSVFWIDIPNIQLLKNTSVDSLEQEVHWSVFDHHVTCEGECAFSTGYKSFPGYGSSNHSTLSSEVMFDEDTLDYTYNLNKNDKSSMLKLCNPSQSAALVMKEQPKKQNQPSDPVVVESAFSEPKGNSIPDTALVIDDNGTIQKMLKMLLEKQGFTVDTAANGQEGLTHLKHNEYTLVYCDFLMPILSGPECIAQFKQSREVDKSGLSWPYIVGISANADSADQKIGLQAGMHAFQQKPVKPKLVKSSCELVRAMKVVNQIRASMELAGTIFSCIKPQKQTPIINHAPSHMWCSSSVMQAESSNNCPDSRVKSVSPSCVVNNSATPEQQTAFESSSAVDFKSTSGRVHEHSTMQPSIKLAPITDPKVMSINSTTSLSTKNDNRHSAPKNAGSGVASDLVCKEPTKQTVSMSPASFSKKRDTSLKADKLLLSSSAQLEAKLYNNRQQIMDGEKKKNPRLDRPIHERTSCSSLVELLDSPQSETLFSYNSSRKSSRSSSFATGTKLAGSLSPLKPSSVPHSSRLSFFEQEKLEESRTGQNRSKLYILTNGEGDHRKSKSNPQITK